MPDLEKHSFLSPLIIVLKKSKSQHKTAEFFACICVFGSRDWILGFLYAIQALSYLAMFSGLSPLFLLRRSLSELPRLSLNSNYSPANP